MKSSPCWSEGTTSARDYNPGRKWRRRLHVSRFGARAFKSRRTKLDASMAGITAALGDAEASKRSPSVRPPGRKKATRGHARDRLDERTNFGGSNQLSMQAIVSTLALLRSESRRRADPALQWQEARPGHERPSSSLLALSAAKAAPCEISSIGTDTWCFAFCNKTCPRAAASSQGQ